MNIFTAFNDGYVFPTRVMLKSLILNNPDPLRIFVFYSSLKQESIDAIKGLEEKGRVSFSFQKVDDTFLDGIEIPKQFSKETYYRLLAHRLFAEEIERVLWLDGDIIIKGSLAEFYNQDFKGKLYAAVEDASKEITEEKHIQLRMPPDSKYVNTGVLLFNLREMRKELKDQEILQYLTDNQEILSLADQDVLNGLLHDRILAVDSPRWYNFSRWYITEENKRMVYENARLIHYCGQKKPWEKKYSGLGADLWWKYALLTGPEYRKLYPVFLFSQTLSKIKKALRKLARIMLPTSVYARLNSICRSGK